MQFHTSEIDFLGRVVTINNTIDPSSITSKTYFTEVPGNATTLKTTKFGPKYVLDLKAKLVKTRESLEGAFCIVLSRRSDDHHQNSAGSKDPLIITSELREEDLSMIKCIENDSVLLATLMEPHTYGVILEIYYPIKWTQNTNMSDATQQDNTNIDNNWRDMNENLQKTRTNNDATIPIFVTSPTGNYPKVLAGITNPVYNQPLSPRLTNNANASSAAPCSKNTRIYLIFLKIKMLFFSLFSE